MRVPCFALALWLFVLPAYAGSLDPAVSLLERGHADEALAVVGQVLATNAQDAAALNLQCRVLLSEQRAEEAEPPCDTAVQLAPGSSNYHLWLGRVLGRRAERAPVLKAYGIAKRVHIEFETAYRLDPHNAEAAADLGTFYVRAPRLLGGGQAKAVTLAGQLLPWAPALAHGISAELAENSKDLATAEREFQAATLSRGATPETYVYLAGFYRRQSRTPEMLASLDKAIALDTAHDDVLVLAAAELTHSRERPQEAIALLRTYLDSEKQSEEAPAFRVHAQLARLLAASGDQRGAQQELTMAHTLASGWQPPHHEDQGA